MSFFWAAWVKSGPISCSVMNLSSQERPGEGSKVTLHSCPQRYKPTGGFGTTWIYVQQIHSGSFYFTHSWIWETLTLGDPRRNMTGVKCKLQPYDKEEIHHRLHETSKRCLARDISCWAYLANIPFLISIQMHSCWSLFSESICLCLFPRSSREINVHAVGLSCLSHSEAEVMFNETNNTPSHRLPSSGTAVVLRWLLPGWGWVSSTQSRGEQSRGGGGGGGSLGLPGMQHSIRPQING